jgi:hypothetical protein
VSGDGYPNRPDQTALHVSWAEGFRALQRGLRRTDARWYYRCRLRSIGAWIFDSMKYLNPGTTGAVVFAQKDDPALGDTRQTF